MKMTTYKMTSSNNTLCKKMSLVKDYDVELKLPNKSILHPTVIVSSQSYEDLNKFNYVNLEVFKRFYYVDDIRTLNNNLYEIDLRCDSFTSWKEEIKSLNVFCERQEYNFNPYIIDPEYILQNNVNWYVKQEGAPVIDNYYTYLTVCGGKA